MLYIQPQQSKVRPYVLHIPSVVHMRHEPEPLDSDPFRFVSQAGVHLGPAQHTVHWNVQVQAGCTELVTDGQPFVSVSGALETREPEHTKWTRRTSSVRFGQLFLGSTATLSFGGHYSLGVQIPTLLLRLVVERETTQSQVRLLPSGTSMLVV